MRPSLLRSALASLIKAMGPDVLVSVEKFSQGHGVLEIGHGK